MTVPRRILTRTLIAVLAVAAVQRQERDLHPRLVELIRAHFPLTPRGIIQHLDLKRPIYRATAAYGHFGRSEPGFTWESIRLAEVLRRAAAI